MGPARRARRGDGRAGYPDDAAQGRRDHRPAAEPPRTAQVFHAGTALRDGKLGHQRRPRALRHRARRHRARWRSSAPTRRCAAIRFDGAQYRRDIGHRAIARRLSIAVDTRRDVARTTCSACRSASSPRSRREDGDAVLARRLAARPGRRLEGDGISRLVEDGALLERGGCGFSHVHGPRAAAVGDAAPAASSPARRSRRWASRWSSIRATPTCRRCT